MAKIGTIPLALLQLLLIVVVCVSQLEAAEDRFALSIIHINDFHARQVHKTQMLQVSPRHGSSAISIVFVTFNGHNHLENQNPFLAIQVYDYGE